MGRRESYTKERRNSPHVCSGSKATPRGHFRELPLIVVARSPDPAQADAQIAAIAQVRRTKLATRHAGDFAECRVDVVNPQGNGLAPISGCRLADSN